MLALLTLVLAAWAATPAAASPLDEAKSRGTLGERYDGYLGVVKPGTSAADEALAQDINAKRKAHYAKIGAKNGASVTATAAIAGAKLVEAAPSGQYVLPAAGGSWERVP